MSLLASIVDWGALGRTIWTATVGGLGFCVVFAVGILGITRSSEAQRLGARGSSAAYGALGVAGLLSTAAAVVYGVALIAT